MVNDLVKRALCSAGVPSILEPAGLSLPDGKRPDGLTLVPWEKGKCLTWDFTCNDTLAPSHLQTSAQNSGETANIAERLKIKKYSTLSDSYIIMPIAIETFGVHGEWAGKFLKQLGGKIQHETGEPRSLSFLRQAIGIAIQRGNAIAVMGSLPPSKSLDEIYYVDTVKLTWKAESKVGSRDNFNHVPGGGDKKVESRKVAWNAQSKVGSKENYNHVPGGGDKKVESRKLEWQAGSRVGSLQNASHKPGGGDKPIEVQKLDFKDKAQPKVGTLEKLTHKPGGGNVQIPEQKLTFKETAAPKIKSMPSNSGSENVEEVSHTEDVTQETSGSANSDEASNQLVT